MTDILTIIFYFFHCRPWKNRKYSV